VTVTSELNGIAIEVINQYPTYGPTAPKIDTRDQILEIAQTVRPATKAQVIKRSGTKDGFNPFVSPIIDQHGESDGLQRYMLSYGRKGNHFPDGDAFMMILPDVEPGTHLTIQGFGTRITKGVAQAEWSATVVAP
jgi:hypothetical protein